MTFKKYVTTPVFSGIFWGIIGGLFLILAIFISTKGLIHISPYPLILIASIITVINKNLAGAKNIFRRLFTAGFISFLIMSVILSAYISLFINPNSGITLYGYSWRLGVILLIGCISSVLLALLAKPVNKALV